MFRGQLRLVDLGPLALTLPTHSGFLNCERVGERVDQSKWLGYARAQLLVYAVFIFICWSVGRGILPPPYASVNFTFQPEL